MDCEWQHYTLCQGVNATKKAINTVQYLRLCNAMIKFENRITAPRTGVIFSLKVKGVRVSPSTRIGRHLTSTSSYIKVWVSAVYMFIDHNLLAVILGVFVVIYRPLQSTMVTPRYVRFTV